ncbi:branched-chain amino acid ABC transporter permease [bacterium]|nr:branched-chain amino acid ABC transporter permease [bacterium]
MITIIRQRGLPVVLIVILLFFPQLFGILHTNMFLSFSIMSMYAVSLNLMLGYTGLLSFGHAMFFGTGAYATSLILTHIEGFPVLLSILTGCLAAVIMAVITAPLLVRVSGTAFAMLTLAFGQLMYVICLKFREITGGEDGLGGFTIPPFLGIDLTDTVNFYYFAMVILLLCLGAMWFFTQTPFGNIIVGIRDNVNRVDYLGFQVHQTKAIVFLISGGFAGIAGSVYALFQNLVSPEGTLGVFVSFNPIVMAVVGGLGSFFGPVVGAGILTILEETVSEFTDRIDLINGIFLIIIILYAPTGIVGLWHKLKEALFKKETAQ